jgi:hypothetical protein
MSGLSFDDNTDFNSYIKSVMDNLNIKDNDVRPKITKYFDQFSDSEKYKLIYNDEIKEKMEELKKADRDISEFLQRNDIDLEKNDELKTNCNDMLFNFGKLQGLILLQKVRVEKDCTPVVNGIVSALNQKLDLVNQILEINIKNEETQKGGYYLNYNKKYLKYKNKISLLKNTF